MTQKELMKILKEYLEIKMRVLDDNTKVDVKETSYVLGLNPLLHHGQSGIFEKLMTLFCITNKYL